MASAKANKKASSAAVVLPECPVCMETMSKPIFQCQSGHSLCSACTAVLCPPNCPICRQPMTQMRNWQLEEVIDKAKVSCPNKSSGCVYTMGTADVEDHLKECIFRQMQCPIGTIFGKCSWSGKVFNMMDHFKERHPSNCNVSTDSDVDLYNVNVKEDDRHLYLVAQGKLLFILTLTIDTLQEMAYWAIQHIGGKKVAQQHIYEIQVTCKTEPRRKVTYIEYCYNDALKPDDLFRQSKCAILPLASLESFMKDKKLSFRFFIRRIPPPQSLTAHKENDKTKGPKNVVSKGPGPAQKKNTKN